MYGLFIVLFNLALIIGVGFGVAFLLLLPKKKKPKVKTPSLHEQRLETLKKALGESHFNRSATGIKSLEEYIRYEHNKECIHDWGRWKLSPGKLYQIRSCKKCGFNQVEYIVPGYEDFK